MMLKNYIKIQRLKLPLIILFLIITMFYFIVLNWKIECDNPNKLIIIQKEHMLIL